VVIGAVLLDLHDGQRAAREDHARKRGDIPQHDGVNGIPVGPVRGRNEPPVVRERHAERERAGDRHGLPIRLVFELDRRPGGDSTTTWTTPAEANAGIVSRFIVTDNPGAPDQRTGISMRISSRSAGASSRECLPDATARRPSTTSHGATTPAAI